MLEPHHRPRERLLVRHLYQKLFVYRLEINDERQRKKLHRRKKRKSNRKENIDSCDQSGKTDDVILMQNELSTVKTLISAKHTVDKEKGTCEAVTSSPSSSDSEKVAPLPVARPETDEKRQNITDRDTDFEQQSKVMEYKDQQDGNVIKLSNKKQRKRKRVRKRKRKDNDSMNNSVGQSNYIDEMWSIATGIEPALSAAKQNPRNITFDSSDSREEEDMPCKVVIKEMNDSTPPVVQVFQQTNTSLDLPPQGDDSWKETIISMADRDQVQPTGRKNTPMQLVAGAKVFTRGNRVLNKRHANFAFSKAEQLSTNATNKSFIFTVRTLCHVLLVYINRFFK